MMSSPSTLQAPPAGLADRLWPWALALWLVAVVLVARLSPNRYAWMLDEPGQALPADEASLFKAVGLWLVLALPTLFVAWLTARSERRSRHWVGAAAVLLSVLVGVARGVQWVMQGQLK